MMGTMVGTGIRLFIGEKGFSFDFLHAIIRHFYPPRSLVSANRVFSHDVTAPILVSQNNKTAAMLVSQTNPLGVEHFSYRRFA